MLTLQSGMDINSIQLKLCLTLTLLNVKTFIATYTKMS